MAPRRQVRIPSVGKIYVVFKGRNPGFYYSWPECEAQVSGFHANLHKSYNTMAEAESAWLRYWSRRAAFGEVHAAATALEGQSHDASDAHLLEHDDSIMTLQLHGNQDVHTTGGVIASNNHAGRNPYFAISIGLVIMAVVWVLFAWM